MSGINSKHRKHYKAGSIWKPGEQEEISNAADSWAKRVFQYLKLLKEGKRAAARDSLLPGDIKGGRRDLGAGRRAKG